jgi:hypothetical protein
MASVLHVPRHHYAVLVELSRLEPGSYELLKGAVAGDERVTDLNAFRSRVRALEEISDRVRDSLVDALLGMCTARSWVEGGAPVVASAVAKDDGLDLSGDERASLEERISELITSPSVEVLAKAIDVVSEQSRVFLRSRMVTDIRPAFGYDDESTPMGAVLAHTLRLDVQEDGVVKSIYIGLDEADLSELRATLEREALKTDGLRERLSVWGFPLIRLGDSTVDSPTPEEEAY